MSRHRNKIGLGHVPETKNPLWSILRVFVSVFIGIVCMGIFVMQPSFARVEVQSTDLTLPPAKLKEHVLKLSEEFHPRNYSSLKNLEKTADYIQEYFESAGGVVTNQLFKVDGNTYRNVIGSFGPKSNSILVVGAHYDSCAHTPGADDNASGVAGLLELAVLLGKSDLKQEVRLVAFTLEEPPFFATPNMGSARYAQMLKQSGIKVDAMICLEMIGYFSDIKGSQRFPTPLLKLFYPSTGNYIGVIGSTGDRKLISTMKEQMREASTLPVYSMCAPKTLQAIALSDHRNFWDIDVTSVMITDTAFYRNHHYHQKTDTADRLNYVKMEQVVLGVYGSVMHLASNRLEE